MHLLVVEHQVQDYDRFKAVFDAHPPDHGHAASHVLGHDAEHGTVIIIATFASRDQAVAWRDDPELRAAVADAGVVGRPRVAIYEQVEAAADT